MKAILSIAFVAAFAAAAPAHATRVLVAHFAPFAPTLPGTAVSVNVNGSQVLTGVQFNQNSPYLVLSGPGVAPGNTALAVYAPPGAPTPAITATPNLAADTDYSVAAIGDVTNQPLALLPLVDDNSAPAAGNVKLRIVHAAPFSSSLAATAVSVRTQSGSVVNGLSNVQFGQNSGYFQVPAGTYNLKIASPDGSQTFINLAPVTLPAGTIATLYAIGDVVNQPLGVTAVFSDGTSAALPLQAAAPTGIASAPTLTFWGLLALAAILAITVARRGRKVSPVRSK